VVEASRPPAETEPFLSSTTDNDHLQPPSIIYAKLRVYSNIFSTAATLYLVLIDSRFAFAPVSKKVLPEVLLWFDQRSCGH
jgi:hypothetical protein